jgi:glycosyltransferase involved in cell wall biosynthesis
MTYLSALFSALEGHGIRLHVHVTVGLRGSKKPYFKLSHLPANVTVYTVPGYIRIGRWFVQLSPISNWIDGAIEALNRKFGSRIAIVAGIARRRRLLRPNIFKPWDIGPAEGKEAAYIEKEIRQSDAAAVGLNYAFLCPAVGRCPPGRGKVFVVAHEVLSARQGQILAAGISPDTAPITLRDELDFLGLAHLVVAIHFEDQKELQRLLPSKNIVCVPHVTPTIRSNANQIPGRVMFVGGGNLPNIDGMRNFLSRIWPRLRSRLPTAELHICGMVCRPLEVEFGQVPGVVFRGAVPDLSVEYGAAELCIAPLRIGAGLKIKLIEALANGRACISTPVGVLGVEKIMEKTVEIASNDEEFADKMFHILTHPRVRQCMEIAGHRVVSEVFLPENGIKPLADWICGADS